MDAQGIYNHQDIRAVPWFVAETDRIVVNPEEVWRKLCLEAALQALRVVLDAEPALFESSAVVPGDIERHLGSNAADLDRLIQSASEPRSMEFGGESIDQRAERIADEAIAKAIRFRAPDPLAFAAGRCPAELRPESEHLAGEIRSRAGSKVQDVIRNISRCLNEGDVTGAVARLGILKGQMRRWRDALSDALKAAEASEAAARAKMRRMIGPRSRQVLASGPTSPQAEKGVWAKLHEKISSLAALLLAAAPQEEERQRPTTDNSNQTLVEYIAASLSKTCVTALRQEIVSADQKLEDLEKRIEALRRAAQQCQARLQQELQDWQRRAALLGDRALYASDRFLDAVGGLVWPHGFDAEAVAAKWVQAVTHASPGESLAQHMRKVIDLVGSTGVHPGTTMTELLGRLGDDELVALLSPFFEEMAGKLGGTLSQLVVGIPDGPNGQLAQKFQDLGFLPPGAEVVDSSSPYAIEYIAYSHALSAGELPNAEERANELIKIFQEGSQEEFRRPWPFQHIREWFEREVLVPPRIMVELLAIAIAQNIVLDRRPLQKTAGQFVIVPEGMEGQVDAIRQLPPRQMRSRTRAWISIGATVEEAAERLREDRDIRETLRRRLARRYRELGSDGFLAECMQAAQEAGKLFRRLPELEEALNNLNAELLEHLLLEGR